MKYQVCLKTYPTYVFVCIVVADLWVALVEQLLLYYSNYTSYAALAM